MSKSIAIIPPSIAAAAALIIMGEAAADSRSYNLSGFTRVEASAGVEVDLKQGPFSVVADEPDGKFDQLIVEVRGDTLRIGRKSKFGTWFSHGPDYHVTVSAPAYSAVEVSSGAHADGDHLLLKALNVEVSSGAHLQLAGACSDLRVEISSGAHFYGEDLKCETASVDASSGAHAEAFATRSAAGEASSGANVTFHGKPQQLEKDTSSGGTVKSL